MKYSWLQKFLFLFFIIITKTKTIEKNIDYGALERKYPGVDISYSEDCPHKTTFEFKPDNTFSVLSNQDARQLIEAIRFNQDLSKAENREYRQKGTIHSDRDLVLRYPYTATTLPVLAITSLGSISHATHAPFLLKAENQIMISASTIRLYQCCLVAKSLQIKNPYSNQSLLFTLNAKPPCLVTVELNFTERAPVGTVSIIGGSAMTLSLK